MREKPPRWPAAPSGARGERGPHGSPAIARQDLCRSPSHGPEVCLVMGSQHAQRAGVRQWSTGAVGNGRHQGVGHCRRLWGPQLKLRRPGRWRSPAALRHIRPNAEERLLRTDPAAHGDIYGQDDDIGFGVWYAGRATPEGEVEYKHVLELAQAWQDPYVEGYRQGYNAGYSKLLDTLGDETVLLPDVHLEGCAGTGCGATCLCRCHAREWRP